MSKSTLQASGAKTSTKRSQTYSDEYLKIHEYLNLQTETGAEPHIPSPFNFTIGL